MDSDRRVKPLIFPLEALDWPDHELGVFILSWLIYVNAVKSNISPTDIPFEFAHTIVKRLPTWEAQLVKNMALEKAYHKAAAGHFESAGRIFRDYMYEGAKKLISEKRAKRLMELQGNIKSAQIKGGQNRARKVNEQHDIIRQYYDNETSKDKPSHVVRRVLERMHGLSKSQINKILAKRRQQ